MTDTNLIVNKETNEEDHLNETIDGETSDLPQAEAADKVEAPLNKDIINIWKDRTDALIYPSDMYPPFVMGML